MDVSLILPAIKYLMSYVYPGTGVETRGTARARKSGKRSASAGAQSERRRSARWRTTRRRRPGRPSSTRQRRKVREGKSERGEK